jgi:SAM-dependent methyltransferase
MTANIVEIVANESAEAAWTGYIASHVDKDIGSFHFCFVLHALHKSGLSAFLQKTEGFRLAELTSRYDAHLVSHLMKYLVVRKVLAEDGDKLALTEYGRRCLSPTTLAQVGFYIEAYASITSQIAPLLTGQSVYGQTVMRDGKALGAHCATLFTIYHSQIIQKIVVEKRLCSILDLGCGGGAMLVDACKLAPNLKGYGLDIAPGAIDFANELCAAEKLQDRLSFAVGDAFNTATWPTYEDLDAIAAVGALHEHFRDGELAVVNMLNVFAGLIERGKARYIILGEPELYYDNAENDPDLFLIHIFTAQGFPRRKKLWLEVFAKSRLTCEKIYTRAGIGPRFCFYLLTLRT